MYSSSIAKTIYEVAEAIGVVMTVEKVTRSSDRGLYTADMISKGNMKEVRRMMPERMTPLVVPDSILSWVKDPRLDMAWSKALLADLEKAGVEVIVSTRRAPSRERGKRILTLTLPVLALWIVRKH